MRLMSKTDYPIMPKGTKFTRAGKLGLNLNVENFIKSNNTRWGMGLISPRGISQTRNNQIITIRWFNKKGRISPPPQKKKKEQQQLNPEDCLHHPSPCLSFFFFFFFLWISASNMKTDLSLIPQSEKLQNLESSSNIFPVLINSYRSWLLHSTCIKPQMKYANALRTTHTIKWLNGKCCHLAILLSKSVTLDETSHVQFLLVRKHIDRFQK